MLTALINEIDELSLHDGDPGDGSVNEISDYTRPSVSNTDWASPSDGGVAWDEDMQINGPADQAVDYIVFWADGAAVARGQLSGSNVFNSEGEFTIVEGSTLEIQDPE